MSGAFSVCSWLSRLADPRACIIGSSIGGSSIGAFGWNPPERNCKEYYALCEDRKGSHYPFPKLPRPLRFAFRAAVVWHNRQGVRHPVRGVDWFFRWPCCGYAKDPFSPGSFQNKYCPRCGMPYERPYIATRPWQAIWWWERFPGKARMFWWMHFSRRISRLRSLVYDFRNWSDNGDVPF